MCGIVGFVSHSGGGITYILHRALKALEYRGYDSCGIATVHENRIYFEKDKGKIDEVFVQINPEELPGPLGIAHTRWATHGAPSRENAHPHLDCSDSIAVVHNGVIENFLKLRKELTSKGHNFKSETDTECIAHLIEEFMSNGCGIFEAIKKTIRRLEGSYALAVVSARDPGRLYCARNESPLVIGLGEDGNYCASDIPAFLFWTNKVIVLHDGELATIGSESVAIENVNGLKIEREPVVVSWTADMASKSGYPHFMLKEIHEQPKALRDTLKFKQQTIDKFAEIISQAEQLHIAAAGTSYHSGLAAQSMLSQTIGIPSQAIISSEFANLVGNSLSENDVVIAVSQSGETIDTLRAIRHAQSKKSKVLAITNVLGSGITREADLVFYTQAGPEIGVAATKTFLVQLTTFTRIALKLLDNFGTNSPAYTENFREKLNQTPQALNQVINKLEIKTKSLASFLAEKSDAFYLGRGVSVSTALEGALKLKEISYIHAEGYSAGESKHGPIALVDEAFPVIFIAPNDVTRKDILGNVMEMRARGAYIITLGEEGDKELAQVSHQFLDMPQGFSLPFSPILYVVPLQLIAYYTAVKRGYDPDKPRNLAKSVTVP
nr:glutamine--fructose-6-phosphate transaminase (isomerizing) [Candidatus Wukongarchaeota archaeon]